MKNGLVISDTGPIFSLAAIDKHNILEDLFDNIFIPFAVWEELTKNQSPEYYSKIVLFFQNRIKEIKGFNELTFVMDYGESEAIVLYKDLYADYLLIDDKKARNIAESLGIQCIGTIGLLSNAREKGIISELRPLFETFLKNKRYYSLELLNSILKHHQEDELK